jgi:hypothetical protein
VPAQPTPPAAPPAKEPPAAPQPPPFVAPPNRADATPPRSVDVVAVEPSRGEAAAGIAVEPRAARRIAEAHGHFQRGQIAAARRLLEALLDTGSPAAWHELARTYDPHYIGFLSRIDRGSDAQRAAALYREAILLGAEAAGPDLERLRATHPHLR